MEKIKIDHLQRIDLNNANLNYLDRQNNYRVMMHPKITSIPQEPKNLMKKQKILLMKDIMQTQKAGPLQTDEPQQLQVQIVDQNHTFRPKINYLPQQSSLSSLPRILSPSVKIEKSKQFYDYIQEQMAEEYGIDINNGLVIKDKKKLERKGSLPPIESAVGKHIIEQIPVDRITKRLLQVRKSQASLELNESKTMRESSVMRKESKKRQKDQNNQNTSQTRNSLINVNGTDSVIGSIIDRQSIYLSGSSIIKQAKLVLNEQKNQRYHKSLERVDREREFDHNNSSSIKKYASVKQLDSLYKSQDFKMQSPRRLKNSIKVELIKSPILVASSLAYLSPSVIESENQSKTQRRYNQKYFDYKKISVQQQQLNHSSSYSSIINQNQVSFSNKY
ncbi:UNKNOWN [Stylonychia lemnae]|uniref:Uncharacterized protein n=1 Tax=Stylonychia lemnae TaxID=5949 RepID=A0A078AHI8_STYLE|nr:UNKNOWN [Stylonychia lemnae]|eukprot:CDW81321.1 UNKNOWN [Stylonychia lemnae]